MGGRPRPGGCGDQGRVQSRLRPVGAGTCSRSVRDAEVAEQAAQGQSAVPIAAAASVACVLPRDGMAPEEQPVGRRIRGEIRARPVPCSADGQHLHLRALSYLGIVAAEGRLRHFEACTSWTWTQYLRSESRHPFPFRPIEGELCPQLRSKDWPWSTAEASRW